MGIKWTNRLPTPTLPLLFHDISDLYKKLCLLYVFLFCSIRKHRTVISNYYNFIYIGFYELRNTIIKFLIIFRIYAIYTFKNSWMKMSFYKILVFLNLIFYATQKLPIPAVEDYHAYFLSYSCIYFGVS